MIGTTINRTIPAHKLMFSYYDFISRNDIQGVQTYFVWGKNAFIITYLSDSYIHKDYLSTVNEIIDSFKIIEIPQYTDFIPYISTKLGVKTIHPQEWRVDDRNVTFFVTPSDEISSQTNYLSVDSFASGTDTLEDIVSYNINYLKQNLIDFRIIESVGIKVGNSNGHKIIYTYVGNQDDPSRGTARQETFKTMAYYTIIGNKGYILSYNAQLDKYYSYLRTINTIIDSVVFQEGQRTPLLTQSGLRLDGPPVDVAVNQTS